VFDQRKQRVRGLWERNGTFYAQLTMPHPTTGLPVVRRVRLEDKDGVPVNTVPQAVAVMNIARPVRTLCVLAALLALRFGFVTNESEISIYKG